MKEIVKEYWYIFFMVFAIILGVVFCMWSKEENQKLKGDVKRNEKSI